MGRMLREGENSPWGTALWDRAAALRLFFRVADVTLDTAGNARLADVRFVDNVGGTPVWRRWSVGQTLHWHPFKLTLLDTRRAGIHVASEWRDTRDVMRYGGNCMIRDRGVFVLNPSNVVSVAEPLVEALGFRPEADLMDDVLRHRFGWDAHGFGRPCQYLHLLKSLDAEQEARVARAEAA